MQHTDKSRISAMVVIVTFLTVALVIIAGLKGNQNALQGDTLQGATEVDTLRHAAALTTDQKINRLMDYKRDILASLDRVVALQLHARKNKDLLQLNCINDKLTQIKGLKAVFDKQYRSFTEALVTGDAAKAQHAFTMANIAYERIAQLTMEAEQCIGETAVFTGTTEVQIELSFPLDPTEDTLAPTIELPQFSNPEPYESTPIWGLNE